MVQVHMLHIEQNNQKSQFFIHTEFFRSTLIRIHIEYLSRLNAVKNQPIIIDGANKATFQTLNVFRVLIALLRKK